MKGVDTYTDSAGRGGQTDGHTDRLTKPLKIEENRPIIKFNFTYFMAVYSLYIPVYTMYTMLVSGIY